MIKITLISLSFKTPYHVGWRSVDHIIESFTIHRSLIFTSTLVEGDDSKVKDITDLKISSLLPIIFIEKCYKIILPLPPLPSRINFKKLHLNWITLRAVNMIINKMSIGFPYITDVFKNTRESGEIILLFDNVVEKLCFTKRIIHDCSEKLSSVPDKFFERIERYVNRLDRVVNAAEPFRVSGYLPLVETGIVIQGDGKTVDYSVKLLKLLGKIGIGGLRSRGFGKFTAEEKPLCSEELDLLKKTIGLKTSNYLVLLGSYVFDKECIDFDKSIVNKKVVEGYSGPPYDPYVLPYLNIIGAGSIIHIKTRDKIDLKHRIDLKQTLTNAILVFNPVVMGVKID